MGSLVPQHHHLLQSTKHIYTDPLGWHTLTKTLNTHYISSEVFDSSFGQIIGNQIKEYPTNRQES